MTMVSKPLALLSLCLFFHSVMTCWPTESGAVLNMIEHFGSGIFATVMDSYDYTAALNQVLPGEGPDLWDVLPCCLDVRTCCVSPFQGCTMMGMNHAKQIHSWLAVVEATQLLRITLL